MRWPVVVLLVLACQCAQPAWAEGQGELERDPPGVVLSPAPLPDGPVTEPAMPPTAPRSEDTAVSTPELGPLETGLASWYGPGFHQRRTASGERFDRRAFTAAHPSLPFGSRVCVRSQLTGRTVVVRINDRGPHTGNRIIDLSQAAAQALGMIGLGLKPVHLFALDGDAQDCPAP